MKKIAKFSNGFTDTYHGKRDVTAAWAIIFNGEVLNSGHSLDAEKALKTATGNARYVARALDLPSPIILPMSAMNGRAWIAKLAKEQGITAQSGEAQLRALRQINSQRTAAILAAVTIEVVSL